MGRIILRISMDYVSRSGVTHNIFDDVKEIDMQTEGFVVVADAVNSFVREVLKRAKEEQATA
jgi:hypothetical protein